MSAALTTELQGLVAGVWVRIVYTRGYSVKTHTYGPTFKKTISINRYHQKWSESHTIWHNMGRTMQTVRRSTGGKVAHKQLAASSTKLLIDTLVSPPPMLAHPTFSFSLNCNPKTTGVAAVKTDPPIGVPPNGVLVDLSPLLQEVDETLLVREVVRLVHRLKFLLRSSNRPRASEQTGRCNLVA